MHYLLVGNGTAHDLARASDAADSIIQINGCRHAAVLDADKTRHIFIANMGETVSAPLCMAIKEQGALLGDATIIRGRNPFFTRRNGRFCRRRTGGFPFMTIN